MLMTEYETTIILRPDINGEMVEATLDRVREVVGKDGGKLLALNHWGKRKLAYDIDKHARGIYVNAHYLGSSFLVRELERNLRISDNILRFLTVRLAVNVPLEEREVKPYVRPAYDNLEELSSESIVNEPIREVNVKEGESADEDEEFALGSMSPEGAGDELDEEEYRE